MNPPQIETFQIREQGFVVGAKLQDRESFQRHDVWSTTAVDLPHPSSVLPETNPFNRRWKSFEGLSNRTIQKAITCKSGHDVGMVETTGGFLDYVGTLGTPDLQLILIESFG